MIYFFPSATVNTSVNKLLETTINFYFVNGCCTWHVMTGILCNLSKGMTVEATRTESRLWINVSARTKCESESLVMLYTCRGLKCNVKIFNVLIVLIFSFLFCWIKVYLWASDCPVLDFVWHFPWVLKTGWSSSLHSYLLVHGQPEVMSGATLAFFTNRGVHCEHVHSSLPSGHPSCQQRRAGWDKNPGRSLDVVCFYFTIHISWLGWISNLAPLSDRLQYVYKILEF